MDLWLLTDYPLTVSALKQSKLYISHDWLCFGESLKLFIACSRSAAVSLQYRDILNGINVILTTPPYPNCFKPFLLALLLLLSVSNWVMSRFDHFLSFIYFFFRDAKSNILRVTDSHDFFLPSPVRRRAGKGEKKAWSNRCPAKQAHLGWMALQPPPSSEIPAGAAQPLQTHSWHLKCPRSEEGGGRIEPTALPWSQRRRIQTLSPVNFSPSPSTFPLRCLLRLRLFFLHKAAEAIRLLGVLSWEKFLM